MVEERQQNLPGEPDSAEWEEERRRLQNPRIRAFARSLRKIDEVLESDYAFLHCSPERLQLIWDRVQEVAGSLRSEIRPLLREPSRIPRLERARKSAADSLDLLTADLLAKIDRQPRRLTTEKEPEVRRLLCTTLGQLHAFLRDTLSELLEADLREMEGNDYWLSKRLPRDIEEAEWLCSSVDRLHEYLLVLEESRQPRLANLAEWIESEKSVPVGEPWERARPVFDEVVGILVPRLREIRALQGIRYDDMRVLDRYLIDLPAACRTVSELQGLGRRLVERTRSLADGGSEGPEEAVGLARDVRAMFASIIRERTADLQLALRDLTAFVGLWRESIRKRRALQFREARP